VGRGGFMKEIKVMVYGRWISYTSVKQNYETFCNCFKWVGRRLGGETMGAM
jgi:hypothetical protein